MNFIISSLAVSFSTELKLSLNSLIVNSEWIFWWQMLWIRTVSLSLPPSDLGRRWCLEMFSIPNSLLQMAHSWISFIFLRVLKIRLCWIIGDNFQLALQAKSININRRFLVPSKKYLLTGTLSERISFSLWKSNYQTLFNIKKVRFFLTTLTFTCINLMHIV